jgi:NAD(P)-dependent dehydrogenase (short-subunit alcohol dehydrogenase family)
LKLAVQQESDAMKVNLDNKVALVTGAGQNIGKAIASSLAANGAIVCFSDINQENAKNAAAEWKGCWGCKLDVTSEANVKKVIDEIVSKHGRIDILVNNAGVNTRNRVTVDEFHNSDWENIIDVDLKGLYFASKAASKIMKQHKSGRIINIASIVGLVPLRLQCAFAAAKAGVVNFTKAIALELGPHGILVNAIAPGSILCEGTSSMFWDEKAAKTELGKSMIAHVPLGRAGKPEEIAHAALFLAAPESSYITGTVLTVDGGWTAGYAREF